MLFRSADDYQADEQAGVAGLTGDYQTDEQAGVARVSWTPKLCPSLL